MATRWLSLVLAVAWLGLSVPAFAVGVDLKQSGGTTTTWGGVGDSAKVTVTGGAGAGGSGCMPTVAAPTYTEAIANYLSCTLSGSVRVWLESMLFGEDATNNLIRTSGGTVRVATIMTGVTINTTSGTTTVFSGGKTPMASVTGTGAVTATVTFYGNMENTTTNGEAICSLELSGTNKKVGFCRQFTKDYLFYHAVTTVVTGAGATVVAQITEGHVGGRQEIWIASGNKTADALIKTGYGKLHCVIFSATDAAPVSGTIAINDAVSAGTGTALMPTQFFSTSPFVAYQLCPEVPFTTGLYFDFTTTTDVNVWGNYE